MGGCRISSLAQTQQHGISKCHAAQVLEFVGFKERLEQSHSRAQVCVEIPVLALSSPTAQVAASAVQEAAAAAVAQLQVGLLCNSLSMPGRIAGAVPRGIRKET
jgi:hypothetical protein